MAFLMFAFLIFGALLFVIAKYTMTKSFQQKIKTVIKQGSITLSIFNALAIGYALGIHVTYA